MAATIRLRIASWMKMSMRVTSRTGRGASEGKVWLTSGSNSVSCEFMFMMISVVTGSVCGNHSPRDPSLQRDLQNEWKLLRQVVGKFQPGGHNDRAFLGAMTASRSCRAKGRFGVVC